ncbi:MAG: YceI family protein [Saprospiraceae bacterium]|nr:YceI family protein [Saprospiraceae bacterium]
MIALLKRIPIIPVCLLSCLGWSSPLFAQYYVLDDQSSVVLNGSSTVNKFSCECSGNWPAIAPQMTPGDKRIQFTQTSLTIDIKNLDCGNRVMNKDLRETLHAEVYPTISVSLLNADLNTEKGLSNAWQPMRAQLAIKLNGHSNTYWTEVNGRKEIDGSFHFVSTLALKMTDFNITPPRPFLGMIIVHDEMEVALDLWVTMVSH